MFNEKRIKKAIEVLLPTLNITNIFVSLILFESINNIKDIYKKNSSIKDNKDINEFIDKMMKDKQKDEK